MKRVAWGMLSLCAVASALTSACSGEGNTGRSQVGQALTEMIPWVRGRAPVQDAQGNLVIPPEPMYPPIATGKEDPGSGPYDCSALAGLEFSTQFWFETFEADSAYDSGLGPGVGVAEAWSSYDDSSDGVFRTPAELNWYEGLRSRHGALWGMPAQKVDGAPSCNGEKNEWALHFRAGRFNRFGGGFGHPLAEICVTNPAHELCQPPLEAGAEKDAAGFPVKAPGGGNYAPAHNYWDISRYDGVSFWARRGPESEGAIGVVIFDKYTSDDLNRQNETYCRRLRSCRTECVNRLPCSPTDPADENSLHRCFDPEQGLPPITEESLMDEVYPRCGPSACTFPSTYPDSDFEGKDCRPYTFQTHESGEFCFNEGDPTPPETSDRCGDGYGLQVNINSDWKFFKVPFSEMRQFGHGKVSPRLDLETISNIAFVTAKGWIDIYVDNVSFYREAK